MYKNFVALMREARKLEDRRNSEKEDKKYRIV